jgi:RNA polymerase sigma factor (TIGR02999 family)
LGAKKMGSPDSLPITGLLLRWGAGEEECLNELVPLVERELRRIAHHLMRKERQGHTLQTTALVNEAYMKLVDQSRATWQNRAQFVGIAASLMRRILVDHARGLQRNKRGGAAEHLLLDEGLVFSPRKSAALIALDDALEDLARMDPRKAQGRGAALLRRIERGGSSRSAARPSKHGHSRLEHGPGLAEA